MGFYNVVRRYMGVEALNPPNLVQAERAPTSSDKAFAKGTIWLDTTNLASYQWPGVTNWISLGSGTTGAVVSLTGDSGGAIVPVAGNITVVGDSADGLSVVGTAGTLTVNAVASDTTHRGTMATSTNAVSVTGTDATVAVTPASLTARLAAPGAIGGTTPGAGTFTTLTAVGTTSINASGAAVTTIGTGGTGAVNIGNAIGNTAVTGSLTASTTLTATAGNITATNGNHVFGTAGNKIISSSVATTTTAGANSFGSVTLVAGTATVATTAVTANSLIVIWRQSIGATGAAALGQLSVGTITASTSFVINAALTATATSLATTDVSVVGWMIIN